MNDAATNFNEPPWANFYKDIPPINDAQLAKEWKLGLELRMPVHLSQTHLFALTLAAQHALGCPSACGPLMRDLLQDFLEWGARHADFQAEERRLLASRSPHWVAARLRADRSPEPPNKVDK